MADIFTIKMNEAQFKIGKKCHKIVDPPFGQKNALLKKWRDLDAKKDGMSVPEWMEKQNEINVEMIKQYLPTISDKEISVMGQTYTSAVIKHLLEMSEKIFGAIVEKVEKK